MFQKQVVEVEHLHSLWTRCFLQGSFSFLRYWGSSDTPNCHSEHCSFCDQSTSKCSFFLSPENHSNVTLSCYILMKYYEDKPFINLLWYHNFNSWYKNIQILQQEHGRGFNGLAYSTFIDLILTFTSISPRNCSSYALSFMSARYVAELAWIFCAKDQIKETLMFPLCKMPNEQKLHWCETQTVLLA